MPMPRSRTCARKASACGGSTATRGEGIARASRWRGAIAPGSDPRDVLDLVARSRVLCALREGPSGVGGLNQAMQQALGVVPLLAGEPPHGTPVLVLHNDPLSG